MRARTWLLLVLFTCAFPCVAQRVKVEGKLGKEIVLFNGKDLCGWTYFLADPNVKMEDVWRIDGDKGVLICKGRPAGYIRTVADYTNYILRLEWRWAPEDTGFRNSGVLLRMRGEDKIWPKSIEAQLMSGSAGDFWLIDGVKLDTDPARINRDAPTNRIKAKMAEKPIGEWNEYEIIVDGDRVVLKINGQIVNEGTGAEVVPGKICLQSEGAEIHFRNIRLIPILKP
ncbi:MAG: DUF1080 domain-containing protein [bacterium]|nr:DUF1080 domain-containing protein [bacterium]MDW8103663.1 DUF1080 domain-containing protein [Armatimonadota bacterium]